MEVLKNHTYVTFNKINRVPENESGIIFIELPYCELRVGKIDGNHSQEISLSKDCQKDPYIILHELGHALGLVHEHARNDRDKYISIDYGQLDKIGENNFVMINHKTYLSLETKYDYASLMHYEPYTFGSWLYRLFGWPVIKSKINDQYNRMMGQRKKMTFNDYKRINLCYCNYCGWVIEGFNFGRFTKNFSCENSGYLDFDNCSKCICPTGYTGDLCQKIIPSDSKCGNTSFVANRKGTSLIYNKNMTCHIFINATERKKIKITILYVNAPVRQKYCTEDIAYQFKYMRDKGTTGLLLCGHHQKHMKLTSESNSVLVFYKGVRLHSLLVFYFKEVD